ncbi:unnamed protein product [Calypogeia fissa]
MIQSLVTCRGSASSSSSHMHHPQSLICSNLHPTCFRLTPGKSTILGRNLKGYLSRGQQLTACKTQKDGIHRRWKKETCRGALPDDAPFAVAIGVSILSTLVLPVGRDGEDNPESSLFGPDDVRSGAMQIISFIPLFNWLVWVFAWLDTRQPRYLAYSAVYLAPYLKTGLSISPEDSWLPIASILACIIHVQLDISVNAEGAQPEVGDISKVLLEKAQIKDLGIRAEGLVGRLKQLAEKSDSRPMDSALQEDEQKETEEWKATQEEALKKEFEDWDAKLSKSTALEETVTESDS